MTDNERMLIHIPKDGEYIEILGHRIDGFDSFEAFCEHLKKYSDMEDTINRQKAEIEKLTINMNAFGLGMKREKERADSARADAVKEFAEKLKDRMFNYYECVGESARGRPYKGDTLMDYEVVDMIEDSIDNLVKEFTEGERK